MPELPEVETTRRGIAPHVADARVRELVLHERRLRWPIDPTLPARVAGRRIIGVDRRAKYLLLRLDGDLTLILHLGMSGSLRVLPAATPRRLHDHLDLVLDNGQALRFNDPRRFGSLHWTESAPTTHPLLRHLAPEPLGPEFTVDYLWQTTRGRRVAIKQLLMNARLVVGVGNIYASEALFRAGIRPRRQARGLKRDEVARLVDAVRAVLAMAIEVGGTTLRDYVGADGSPGYFRQKLFVYERAGEPCRACGTEVRHAVQAQRSTYWCPTCQR
ncbi:MAG: bifunctional DNA-formamidopyrimidine glycosylase/DNA-(apurinic or apyrimidinic site) lyase [Steroidobacteraceae bacterium]